MHVHAQHRRNDGATSKVLRISLVVTLVYIVLLVVAGIRAHSLALLSEAGHNLSDFFALLLSWGAVYLQGAVPTPARPSATTAPAFWRPSSTEPRSS